MVIETQAARKQFNMSWARAAEGATVGLFILALIYTFFFAAAVLLPIFLAALISIVLRPLVRGLRKLALPDTAAAAIVMIAVLIALFFGINRLVEPAQEWLERAPQLLQEVRREFGGISETLDTAREASAQIESITTDEKATQDDSVVVRGPTLLEQSMSYTWTTLTQVLLTLVLIFFFLALGPSTLEGMLLLLPFRRQRQYCLDLVAAVQGQLGTYLRSLTLIYLVLGALTALAMYLLKMPNPLLWGVMAFLLGFVPFIGPLITTATIALVSLVSFDGLLQIMLPVAAYGFLTLMEGFFVTPAVIGRTLTLSPFAIFLSIVFWSWIWGFPGAILAVPILASLKLVIDHAAGLRSVEEAAEQFAPNEPEPETLVVDTKEGHEPQPAP